MYLRLACGVPTRCIGATALALMTLVAVGCGDDSTSDEGAADVAAPSGAPDEWCVGGHVPQVVAFDADAGTIRWVSCTEGRAHRSVQAVTDDAVYVTAATPTGRDTIALDPDDGTVLADAPRCRPPTRRRSWSTSTP